MSQILINKPERDYLTKELDMLRREIEESKERVFKIVTGQVFALPIIGILSDKINSSYYNYVFIIMPFVVLILVLTFAHEQYTIVRAAYYIKINIEPILSNYNANINNWEHWLEKVHYIDIDGKIVPYNPRDGDKYMRKAFWALSIIYYLFSVFLALAFLAYRQSIPASNGNTLDPILVPLIALLQNIPRIQEIMWIFVVIAYLLIGAYGFKIAFRRCPLSIKEI
jgi:hypothetical protein